MATAVDGLSKMHTNRAYNILEFNYIVFPLTLILPYCGREMPFMFQRQQEIVYRSARISLQTIYLNRRILC